MTNNITLNISGVTNNGVPCKDPIILVIGHEGEMAFPCTEKVDKDGNLKISLPDNVFTNKCVKIAVQCSDCDTCGERERTICLCDTSADCPACSDCIDGICVTLCNDGEKCVDNTCCECSTNGECAPGFFCDGCNCRCNGKVNSRGECVECLSTNDCGPCQECKNGGCVDIVCPNNLICIGGECGCPPGSKYDVASNSCIPADECKDDNQCAECETCVAGFCQPIVCPDGYKCVGGECVYWPCVETSCNNGADCGPDCGCLDGECVPCYILECTGECQEALGCKCNASNKCEPVNNCGQYCDGQNPCLDENCTCYNNECVGCENFPCIDTDGGCSSYYNCGCNDNGDCEGGFGCGDKLELKKVENCPTECALEAVYTSENDCMCDPITFKIKNVSGCNDAPANALLSLNIEMFKNGRPYKDYLNEITIGDNEFISGVVNTKILFQTKDNTGRWVNESISVPEVDSVAITNNALDNIIITPANLGFGGATPSALVANRRATITVTVQGVQVPNNDCINYGTKVLSTYVIDFTQNANYCQRVDSFKVVREEILKDNTSFRRPLFIFSKSNSGTYHATKFPETTNYNASGWFRKEYGVKSGSTWKVKLDKVSNGLWNNYNYKVTVDCGCKQNNATLEKVVFCCPTEFKYNLTQCGRKIEILPFETCEVNKRLGVLSFTPGAKNLVPIGPVEIQTLYYVILNGQEFLLRGDGGNLLSTFTKELNESITSIVFEQRYGGNALVKTACPVEYSENNLAPDYKLDVECGKITVTRLSNTPNITGVTSAGITFTSTNQNVWVANVDKQTEAYDIAVAFQNGCVFVKRAEVVCEPEVEATPSEIVAKGECPEGGTNPDIVVKAVSGFSSAVKFIDPRNNLEFSPDNISNLSKTFTNFGSGSYTFVAIEGTKRAEVTVTIQAPKQPELRVINACGNNPGKIILENGAPNSNWKLASSNSSAFGSGQTVTLNSSGFAEVTINTNQIPNGGLNFTVSFVSDSSGTSCTAPLSSKVEKDGGTVTPEIIYGNNTICGNGSTTVRINDGGLNLTYTVSISNATISGFTQESMNGGQEYTITPNNLSTTIGVTITGISSVAGLGGCYTLGQLYISSGRSVEIVPEVTIIRDCDPSNNGNIITLQTISNNSIIAVDQVVIDGYNISFTPNVGYVYNFITSDLITPVEYTISKNGCVINGDFLPIDCTEFLCPPAGQQTPQIVSSPPSPTCSQATVTLSYTGGVLNIEGGQYAWYKNVNGVAMQQSSGIVGPANWPFDSGIPNLSVTSETNTNEYYLQIITNSGACVFTSNTEEVFIGDGLDVNILGPSIGDNITLQSGTNYTYSTLSIPGATYVWTITPPGGPIQTLVSTTNQVTLSMVGGINVLSVTVTTVDNCTDTASVNLEVNLNCQGTVVLGYASTEASNLCKNISATLSGVNSTVVSWTWYVNGVAGQNGLGLPIVNFDTSVITPGDTVNISIEVVLQNGCTITNTVPFVYERCSLDFDFVGGVAPLSINAICGVGSFFSSVAFNKLEFSRPCSGSNKNYIFKLYVASDLVNPLGNTVVIITPSVSCNTTTRTPGFLQSVFDKTTYAGNTFDFVIKIFEDDGITQVGPNVVFPSFTFPTC